MAALKQPSPGLYSAVLHVLSNSSPRSKPMASTMAALADDLTSEEAKYLPEAIAAVLPLLNADTERLHFAAEIASRLGFFETAPAMVDLAVGANDRELLLTAATLCVNPAVDASVRAHIANTVGDDPASLIRFDPHTTPETADQRRLYLQSWPGARDGRDSFAMAPVVVLDGGFDSLAVLKLALALDKAGAVVRRLAPDSEIPFWFGSQTVLLCQPQTRSRVLSRYPRFSEAQIITGPLPDSDYEQASLLRKINAALPGRQGLRFTDFPPEVSTTFWTPDIFAAGVYESKEAAFLAGTKRSSLDYLRRKRLLKPRQAKAIRWAFRDLVAVRAWTYMNSVSPRRVPTNVVPALSQFVGDAKAVRLGVTSRGSVMVDHGDGWVNVATGQRTLEIGITDIDEIFRPFLFGRGRIVGLLEPSLNTKLVPTVLHGTPHLKGHRISAKGLARLDQRSGRDAILSAYPELEKVSFDDTVNVGHQLLLAS